MGQPSGQHFEHAAADNGTVRDAARLDYLRAGEDRGGDGRAVDVLLAAADRRAGIGAAATNGLGADADDRPASAAGRLDDLGSAVDTSTAGDGPPEHVLLAAADLCADRPATGLDHLRASEDRRSARGAEHILFTALDQRAAVDGADVDRLHTARRDRSVSGRSRGLDDRQSAGLNDGPGRAAKDVFGASVADDRANRDRPAEHLLGAAKQDRRPACGAARFDRLVAADKDRGAAGQPKDILLAGADPRAHVGAADGLNPAGTDDRAAGRAGLEDRRRTAAVDDRGIGHAAGRNNLQPGSLDRGAGGHAAHVLLAADLRCGIDAADKFGPAELDRRAARRPA
jgi:hypothetical protein